VKDRTSDQVRRHAGPSRSGSRDAAPAEAALLRLQRSAGNRAVADIASGVAQRRLSRKRASTAERPHPLAQQIAGATQRAKEGDLDRRENVLDYLLTFSNTPKHDRPGYVRELRVIEDYRRRHGWNVRNQLPHVRSSEEIRRKIERNHILGICHRAKSIKWGLERASGDPEQEKLIAEDAKEIGSEFKSRALEISKQLLRSSAAEIVAVLRQYGLHEGILGLSSLPDDDDKIHEAIEDRIRYTRGGEGLLKYRAEGARKSRADLTKQIKRLKYLQAQARELADQDVKINGSPVTRNIWKPLDEAIRGKPKATDPSVVITNKLRAARLKLTTEWLAAEREHPILAAYRGGKIDELEDVQLGKADASDDDRMRATLARAIPKLVNIRKALNYLDKGYVSPVEIAPAVALARRDMLIPPGSKWDPAVLDKIAEEKDKSAPSWIVELLMFAASFTLVGAALASFYQVMKEYIAYSKQDVLANTDLERARSLSDQEPSLTGLAVALVGAGLAGGTAAKVFSRARNLRKLAITGDEGAMFELRRIADTYHVDLTDVVPEPKPKPATTPAPKPPPTPQPTRIPPRGSYKPKSEEDVGKPSGRYSPTDKGKGSRPFYAKDPKPPAKPPAQPPAKPPAPPATREHVPRPDPRHLPQWAIVNHATEAEFRAGFRKAVNELTAYDSGWDDLVSAVGAMPGFKANNQELWAMLRKIRQARGDPAFLEESAAALWREAARRQVSTAKHLEHVMGPVVSVNRRTLTPELFRDRVLRAPGGMIDNAFSSDLHGAHTHLFDLYLVKRLGFDERRFRQLLARVNQPRVRSGDREKAFYEAAWDALFDANTQKSIFRPEDLGPILQQHLGFPRW
jgi:hypothetical protein